MDIAILLYDRFAALDAVGPYEVLHNIPASRVSFVAAVPGPKRTEDGSLGLIADIALSDLRAPEVVVVPGGAGEAALLEGGAEMEWLRAAYETSTWMTSVCTGALILGRAGLLRDLRATTYWLALDRLREYGATAVGERVVIEETSRIITSAGVSSGIDMALTLAARLAGETVARRIQLGIEYDPHPPFASGSPATASAEDVEALRRISRF